MVTTWWVLLGLKNGASLLVGSRVSDFGHVRRLPLLWGLCYPQPTRLAVLTPRIGGTYVLNSCLASWSRPILGVTSVVGDLEIQSEASSNVRFGRLKGSLDACAVTFCTLDHNEFIEPHVANFRGGYYLSYIVDAQKKSPKKEESFWHSHSSRAITKKKLDITIHAVIPNEFQEANILQGKRVTCKHSTSLLQVMTSVILITAYYFIFRTLTKPVNSWFSPRHCPHC